MVIISCLGTHDVSILTLDGGIVEVKATGVDTHVGGSNIDLIVESSSLLLVAINFLTSPSSFTDDTYKYRFLFYNL